MFDTSRDFLFCFVSFFKKNTDKSQMYIIATVHKTVMCSYVQSLAAGVLILKGF